MNDTPATHDSIPPEAVDDDMVNGLSDLLMELCRIDTTPRPDVASLAADEARCFQIIEEHLQQAGVPGLCIERRPINPAIERHRFYSNPAYAAVNGSIPSATSVYRGRDNLLALVEESKSAPGLAINVHVDVVHPYIPPRKQGRRVLGRGACDDKGPLVALLGAMRLLGNHLRRHDLRLARPLTLMFVIDEESGGNGSLSLAVDRHLKDRYDTLLVLECCSSRIHPGNRGAVWYQVTGGLEGVNMLEAGAFIIDEMEATGRAIKAESRHALFPHRPVQTCHGILGSFGEHPSRICGYLEFIVAFADGAKVHSAVRALLEDVLTAGLQEYIGQYGDKTRTLDPTTQRPKVQRHFDLIQEDSVLYVQVFGSTGHMGSILEKDAAITKAAALIRALIRSRQVLEACADGRMELKLTNWTDSSRLLMEGGQGFLPTHDMVQVQDRLRQAVWRGMERYLCQIDQQDLIDRVRESIRVTYDKLHNAAFAADPDSPAMHQAIEAARAAGIWREDQPVCGWDVSCDARLFACEYPDDLVVLTGGPGHLRHAHADDEQIDIDDVVSFARFLMEFILNRCGVRRSGQPADHLEGGKS